MERYKWIWRMNWNRILSPLNKFLSYLVHVPSHQTLIFYYFYISLKVFNQRSIGHDDWFKLQNSKIDPFFSLGTIDYPKVHVGWSVNAHTYVNKSFCFYKMGHKSIKDGVWFMKLCLQLSACVFKPPRSSIPTCNNKDARMFWSKF